MERKEIFGSKNGVTILEVIVASVIVITIYFALSSMLLVGYNNAKNIRQSIDFAQVTAESSTMLGMSSNCTATFQNELVIGTGTGTLAGDQASLYYTDSSGNRLPTPFLSNQAPSNQFGEVTITSVKLTAAPQPVSPAGTYLGNLEIDAVKNNAGGTGVGPQQLKKNFDIIFSANAANQVTTCFAAGGAGNGSMTSQQICTALSGQWNTGTLRCVLPDAQLSDTTADAAANAVTNGLYIKKSLEIGTSAGGTLGIGATAGVANQYDTLHIHSGLPSDSYIGDMGMGMPGGEFWTNGGNDSVASITNTGTDINGNISFRWSPTGMLPNEGNLTTLLTIANNGTISIPGTLQSNNPSFNGSDRRFKKNIQTLSNALENILKLRGVEYEWRRDEFPDRKFGEGKQVGLIAQELEKVYPEFVQTGKDGYKSVSYANIVAVLIEGIKSLWNELAGLKSELAQVKDQNAKMGSELQELKALVCGDHPNAATCKKPL